MTTSFNYVASRRWLITEEYLKFILELTARVNPSLEDVEKQLGKKLENKSRPASSEGEIRIIPVIGPIVRYADIFSEISGATSLSSLIREFNVAVEDDSVSAILFDIDSPGGEAAGINEFAETIFNARGKKPMISYVSNMACSAAYWIASATDEIICDDTATLGSIGCAGVITDTTERDEKAGIKNIEFVSSNSPNKRPDVKTDEGRALVQKQIDDIGNIFIKKVARNRSTEDNKLTSSDVIEDFNRGGVLTGKDAVKAGLADKLGSLESTLKNLQSGDITSLINKKETSMKLENKDTKVTESNKEEVTVADESTPSKVVSATVAATSGGVIPQVSVTDFEALKKEEAKKATQLAEMEKSIKALEARNHELSQVALKTAAENYILTLSDRIIPAQRDGILAGYIQAANDDTNNPIEGVNRLENFKKLWDGMPEHKLTEELMEDEDTSVLENDQQVDSKAALVAALDAQAVALAASLNKKNASSKR